MISFTPTEEQKLLTETIHRYAENDVRKVAHEADETSDVPAGLVDKGWEIGILPGLIPETYGGFGEEGQTAITGVLALEELAWGDLSVALNLWTPATFALAVLASGSEEQKEKYLPLFCDIDRPAMTTALIEPSVTFDPWRPSTTATTAGSEIKLNGSKVYVPLADAAKTILVFATDEESGKVNGYIVDAGQDGVEVGEREKLMGIRALPTYPVTLTDVTVSEDAILGGAEGTNYAAIVSRSQIALGALAVGVARASNEYAIQYAKERVQFGVPIATKQAVAFNLAESAIEIEALRNLVWEAAWKADKGEDLVKVGSQLKAYISKVAMQVTDMGVQTLGGYGYIREYPTERWLRNARGFATFDGLALV